MDKSVLMEVVIFNFVCFFIKKNEELNVKLKQI